MPYKDPERRREKKRQWQVTHLEKHRESCRRWRLAHSEEQRERIRKWSIANPEKIREYARKQRIENPERKRASDRRWGLSHPDRVREKARRRRALHPEVTMMRNMIQKMLRIASFSKISRTRQYIGCTSGFLRNHLEEQFLPGMTWENHGNEWEVDHIVPLSWWDIKNHPEHLFEASHWTNLQPMWKKENMYKGDRRAG